jgi:ParB family transcriptional regulator, chromosome partitioning protein
MEIIDVDINEIVVANRKRGLNQDKVTELANSINEIGLMQPIGINKINNHYELIFGLHRLEAFKLLKKENIPSNVFEFGNDEFLLIVELMEIDENLLHNDLDVLERGEHWLRRKEILIELGKWKNQGNQPKSEMISDLKIGTIDLGKEIGISDRSIRQNIQIARDIPDEIKNSIRDTSLADSTTQLLDLARMGLNEQKKVATLVSDLIDKVGLGNDKSKDIKNIIKTVKIEKRKNDRIENSDDILESLFQVNNGEIWQLGNHRLMCGNSYSQLDINKLLNNNIVTALVTDPPYGIDYKPNWNKWDGSLSDFTPVIGDDQDFNPIPFLNYSTVVLFGANYFSNKLPIGGWICWDKRSNSEDDNSGKDNMIASPFELAWYRSINTTKKAIMIRVLHGGVVNADSIKGNNEKRLHPTQKPIKVMEQVLEETTTEKDIIFDPFSGVGSTLLACENKNRKCFAMELDSKYIAITLQRWLEKTGIQPELVKE